MADARDKRLRSELHIPDDEEEHVLALEALGVPRSSIAHISRSTPGFGPRCGISDARRLLLAATRWPWLMEGTRLGALVEAHARAKAAAAQ